VFAPPNSNAETDIRQMVALAKEMLAGEQPCAIGVSFGGPVDHDRGLVHLSHHVPGWENIRLSSLLETKLSAPVLIDNDANVAALGEHRYGAGRGYQTLLYVTVSTGVGGGWIINGQPWRGHENMAGEIGHTVVDPQGPRCLCGKRGCVERFASGRYIAQDVREELSASPGKGEILRALVQDQIASIDTKLIAEAAARGDDLAIEALKTAARALGVGIGNAANLINPPLILLGGGVTKTGDIFWEGVRQGARMTSLPEIHFEIEPAGLGDDAPLWGAIALVENYLANSMTQSA
jgi:glucokinase